MRTNVPQDFSPEDPMDEAAPKQTRHPQKSPRIDDDGANTDIRSETEISDGKSSETLAIFGNRPLKHETHAVEYCQGLTDKFVSSWSLPSVAVMDERLRGVIDCLQYESALHGFVIVDVDGLLQLLDKTDQEELKCIMITRKYHNFLQQYNMPPDDLDNYLATHGRQNVGDALERKPSEDFQKVAHESITNVLRMYQGSDLNFPKSPVEAWFSSIQLWGIIGLALSRRLS
ncbi:hypothetical protein BGZ83_004051 [Gryganskiella cystojenkinii]|nr:hypothetical protein BGZ83_004051 [Gryganskiella cystojenkinii]